MQKFPVGGFVLVGGQSRRMGRDKALLELHGKPLFLRAVELLRPRVAQVTLLGPPARYSGFGIPVVAERRPGRGPLAALCAGLESSSYQWDVFLACDLPFLEGRFLEFLLQRAMEGGAEAVVPRTADGWQPLCAAYHRSCLARMQKSLARARAGIVEVLESLRVDCLGADKLAQDGFSPRMFKNVNTAADWEEVQREFSALADSNRRR